MARNQDQFNATSLGLKSMTCQTSVSSVFDSPSLELCNLSRTVCFTQLLTYKKNWLISPNWIRSSFLSASVLGLCDFPPLLPVEIFSPWNRTAGIRSHGLNGPIGTKATFWEEHYLLGGAITILKHMSSSMGFWLSHILWEITNGYKWLKPLTSYWLGFLLSHHIFQYPHHTSARPGVFLNWNRASVWNAADLSAEAALWQPGDGKIRMIQWNLNILWDIEYV